MEERQLVTLIKNITGIPNGVKQLHLIDIPKGLPRLIANNYELAQGQLFETSFVFVGPKADEIEVKKLLNHLEVIKREIKIPIGFIFKTLQSHQLKTLMSHKVNFIDLTGNLYLPEALVVIQKQKKEYNEIPAQLSQWAKVAIIKQLVSNELQAKTITELGEIFKISKMHASRFVDELKIFGFVKIEKFGVSKKLNFLPKEDLWKKAQLFLHSPIVKKIYTNTKIPMGKVAGLSALGELTMLDTSGINTIAIGKKDYPQIQNQLEVTPKEFANYCIEVWDWDPEVTCNGNTVDPISLYLSINDQDDDRIQIALKELLRGTLGGN